jgi:hypothetical protein
MRLRSKLSAGAWPAARSLRSFLCLTAAILGCFASFNSQSASADKQLVAQAAKRYKVTAKISGARNGSISPSSSRSINSGGSVSYTVTPKKGYLIESLTVNGAPKTNLPRQKGKSYSFSIKKINENKTVTAAFATARTTKALVIGSQVSVVDAK